MPNALSLEEMLSKMLSYVRLVSFCSIWSGAFAFSHEMHCLMLVSRSLSCLEPVLRCLSQSCHYIDQSVGIQGKAALCIGMKFVSHSDAVCKVMF